jgi:hypothetical protein
MGKKMTSYKTVIPSTRIFQPRPSKGWVWLVFMALVLGAKSIAPVIATGLSPRNAILPLIICIPIAIAFLALAAWFPSMRYELNQDHLILRYGPVLTYRIPLSEIRTIRRRNLRLTIWSTIRFPGIALFSVPYADVGKVKMCSTAALMDILLIETEKEKYGITPADEDAFVTAIKAQMEI